MSSGMSSCSRLAAVALSLAVGFARAQEGCEPWFKHPQIGDFYTLGFAMVDLDPHGWLHLVGNAHYDGLEVWRFGPNGAATFVGSVSSNTSRGLLSGDFDGDGDTDLLTGHISTEAVHFFDNTAGTLVEGPGTEIPGLIKLCLASDFDLDGLPDLVVTTPSDIRVYRNAADGTFTEATSVPFEQVMEILPATLDHDTLPDMLVLTWNLITPLRQRADGTFELLTPIDVYNPGGEPILPGDINGDGFTDILHETHRVMLGEGAGAFGEGPELDPRIGKLIKLHDLDQDGDIDLLVNAADVAGGSGSFSMLNDGAGSFSFLVRPGLVAGYTSDEDTLLADVDRDGFLDVVADRYRSIDLRFGSGDGRFGDVPFYSFFAGTLRRATLGDIDADGDLDIVATGDDPEPAIKVLANDGTGTFTTAAAMAAPSTVYERTALADFDADGDLDILAWTAELGLWIYENTPDGFFSQVHLLPHRDGGPTAVPFVGYSNNDDLPDILAGNTNGEARGYSVYVNRGGWDFEQRFFETPQAAQILAYADFDHDGRKDILCADTTSTEPELQICYRKPFANFYEPQPTTVFAAELPYAMPGDFNGDGWTDFVVYAWISRDIRLMTNQRDGTFLHTATLDRYFAVRDPGVVDLHGDGLDELVCTSQADQDQKAAVVAFNAFGEVIRETRFGNGFDPMLGSPVGDLDSDGAMDILVVASSGGGVSVFLNQCPGAPCLPDLDDDDDTDTQDFLAYLDRWSAQRDADCSDYTCTADLDRNGIVDTRDFITFLAAWAAGC